MVVHADDLRPYEVEEFAEEGEDLWYFRDVEGTPKDRKGPGPVVEKSVAHRVRPDTTLEFLVKWSAWSDQYNTWEPVWALTRACEPWVEYCHVHGLWFEDWELSKCLPPDPVPEEDLEIALRKMPRIGWRGQLSFPRGKNDRCKYCAICTSANCVVNQAWWLVTPVL